MPDPQRRLVSIDEIIEKAFTTGDLATGGLLNPEQAARFVRRVINASKVILEARREAMTAQKKLIEKIGFGTRIMVAATEATAPTGGDIKEPTTTKVELSVVETLAAVDVSYSALEDNIERQALQDTILDLVAERASLDLEELMLHGDTASADTYLALLNGLFKQTVTNSIDFLKAEISKDAFHKALRKLPKKYLRNKADWRFYIHQDIELDYRYLLAERATGAGDRFLTEDVPIFASGVPVIGVPALASRTDTGDTVSDLLLTHPQNIVFGVHRDVMTELERRPRSRTIETTTTVRVDFKYEEEDATVEVTRIKHKVV